MDRRVQPHVRRPVIATRHSAPNPTRGARHWAALSDAALVKRRICDLGLKIQGSELENCIAQFHGELERRNIRFRPHYWLSTEWFSPDGVPGIAIPFYLAHPRLKKLEQSHMLSVEGSNREWCMKLLRHELGHALANAYQLHRRKLWRDHFGSPRQAYPETYLPKPYSKRFVIHLDGWYAQSHPDEDWAETFAVWLKPNSDWRQRYRGWSALKKLQYVDELMAEIHDQPARVRNRAHVESIANMRLTLAEYYAERQATYTVDTPDYYDRHLRRLFSDKPEHRKQEPAAHYLQQLRPEISEIVAQWSHEYRYRIDQIIRVLIQRCERLDLHLERTGPRLKLEVISCVTMLVMEHLHNGGFHVAL